MPTKGALKGFDGIKVSIPTSDINLPAIVSPTEVPNKKKKKGNSKKRRDKKDSESSSKYDSDHRAKDSSGSQKKVDVYEFMDNEDAELFEFRPSTLMERFKSISNKDMPSTSKANPVADEVENSSESGSDGDDFVYMSDDYVCSDDETESSLMSCEMGNTKPGNEAKKTISPLKRKDVVEKNAVMGKIFKHNAMRPEKKIIKSKEPVKPKANLDQLFDSLLEDEPSSSTVKSDTASPRQESPKRPNQSSSKYEPLTVKTFDDASPSKDFISPRKYSSTSPHASEIPISTSSKKPNITSLSKEIRHAWKKYETTSTKKYDSSDECSPSTSKKSERAVDYGPSTSKNYDMSLLKKAVSPKKHESTTFKKLGNEKLRNECNSPEYSATTNDDLKLKRLDSLDQSPTRKDDEGISTSYDYCADIFDQSSFDDTGVARQRARRKCTVGKQNVLAESWSSESEPDGAPPRPASAESVLANGGRKKKGKKKEGQPPARRGNVRQTAFKKQDVESRVANCYRNTPISGVASADPGDNAAESGGSGGGVGSAKSACTSVSTGVQVCLGPPAFPGAAGPKPRPRPPAYNWTSEGDDEQEHIQQHGWIVGDSHKKLVTMLAHAKGRKRNNDDKRHLVE